MVIKTKHEMLAKLRDIRDVILDFQSAQAQFKNIESETNIMIQDFRTSMMELGMIVSARNDSEMLTNIVTLANLLLGGDEATSSSSGVSQRTASRRIELDDPQTPENDPHPMPPAIDDDIPF